MACKQCIADNSADDCYQTNLYQYFWSWFHLTGKISFQMKKKLKKRFFKLAPDETKRCLLAVVFQQCIYSSNTIMNCFSQCLTQNVLIKNELFSKREIRICCLGGGLGTEAIGIGKTIQYMSQKETDKIIDLHVTIIDTCVIWKDVILEAVIINQFFPINNLLQWKFDFIKEDYLQPLSNTAALNISKADCLTMSKFSCVLKNPFCIKKKKIRKKIQNILELTKKNALIYCYEESEEMTGNKLQSTEITHLKCFQKIYKNSGQPSLNLSDMRSVLNEIQLQEFLLKKWPHVATTIWFRATKSEKEEEILKKRLHHEITSPPLEKSITKHDNNSFSCSKNENSSDKIYVPIFSSTSKGNSGLNDYSITMYQPIKQSKKRKRAPIQFEVEYQTDSDS